MNILRKIKESSFYTNKCLINGAWISSDGVNTIDVTNPYDGVVIDSIPVVTKIQISEAIEAAYLAQSKWSATTPSYKREMIHRWKDLILSNIDLLAMLMTLEQGKPLSESVGEINYTASYLDYYADEAIRIYGDVLPPPFPNSDVIVLKEPIGVVGIIAPWNFPIAMFMRKVAPALASGCTCVVKPDEKTPLTAFAMMELACQAGFPKGVINCITGNPQEIGEELSYSKKVRKISFTGSAEVGKLLMKQSASTVKKITLELGGNAPFIVFNDANLEAAAKGLVASKFRNAGQTCVCANRVYIHKDIYDDFCNMLKIEIESLKIGNGIDEGVNVGPIIDDEAVIKIKSFVDET